jgi:pyruvate kinase
VVGSWDKQIDNSHAETVTKALDIPLIIADAKVIEVIGDALPITVDSDEGFIYNGFKHI